MELKELVAKLIDLELDEGGTDVWVRDGRGILGELNEVSITEMPNGVRYVELGT